MKKSKETELIRECQKLLEPMMVALAALKTCRNRYTNPSNKQVRNAKRSGNLIAEKLRELLESINQRLLVGVCDNCGGGKRVPYGTGLPDGEDYDLCPFCNREELEKILVHWREKLNINKSV